MFSYFAVSRKGLEDKRDLKDITFVGFVHISDAQDWHDAMSLPSLTLIVDKNCNRIYPNED